jgi:hypothetical protein
VLQKLALHLYRSSAAQALIRSGIGEKVFHRAYFLASGPMRRPRWSGCTPSSMPIRGSSTPARISASSPSAAGCAPERSWPSSLSRSRQLTVVVAARGLGERVDARQIALAERSGSGHLMLSAESHADHRLGEGGLP